MIPPTGWADRVALGCRRLLLVLLCALTTLTVVGREQTYVVKPKDTLTDIARQRGVSVSALAAHNRIDAKATIHAGQRLAIPSSTKTTAPAPATKLSASVAKSIAAAPVKARRWRNIIIHHSGVDEGTLKGLDRYHREERHMENGLAYHFLIGNGNGMADGEIAVGNRWKKQLDGGHLRSVTQNQSALGICLIGNFDQTKPTAKQLRSLETLSRELLKRCKLPASAVKTHQEINAVHTRCPGRYFPLRDFLARLKQPAQ